MRSLRLIVVSAPPARGRSRRALSPLLLAVFILLQSLWVRLDFAAEELTARLSAGIPRAPLALGASVRLGFPSPPPGRLLPAQPCRLAGTALRRRGGRR